MDLMTWNPLREMDSLFGRTGRGAMRFPGEEEWSPAVDIRETDKAYLITAELPGVEKQDIAVTTENGVLTLAGERRQESEEKDARHHRRERYYGRFSRSFSLPENADADRIEAKSKDGVVEIRVPKREPAPEKQTRIEVK
ncbi:low molecular weight heat shock protein (Hsp17) [Salinisphaera sp. PC39]|uniref:Hsp20/alpha crystallin family protein n=1 Tax=Salinisphaera sp. PC39 TaxID=1304156 RepID=UPI00333EFE83